MKHRKVNTTIDVEGVKVPIEVFYKAFWDIEGDVSEPGLSRRIRVVELTDAVAEPGPLKVQAEGLAADDDAVLDQCYADDRETGR